MASKSSTKQDKVATIEQVPGSIVIYTEEKINTFKRDVKLSVLLRGSGWGLVSSVIWPFFFNV